MSRGAYLGHLASQDVPAQSQESDVTERKCEIREMTTKELDAVSGGKIRWIDIHMPYKDFSKWPGGQPSPTRLA